MTQPSHAMHLVADVLDKQIVDAKKVKLGKVDGLVIVMREGKPPRVAYIESGTAVLARRLGLHVRAKPGCRIPWSKVTNVDIEVTVDVDEHPLLAWEEWLREHVVGRIPFSR